MNRSGKVQCKRVVRVKKGENDEESKLKCSETKIGLPGDKNVHDS